MQREHNAASIYADDHDYDADDDADDDDDDGGVDDDDDGDDDDNDDDDDEDGVWLLRHKPHSPYDSKGVIG